MKKVQDYLKNIWAVQKFFTGNYNIDPPIINSDQMPLHNKSSSAKTLSITGYDTYVKENHGLSREQVTVFTQVSSDLKVLVNPRFVFKGKGTCTVLNPSPAGLFLSTFL